MNKIRFFLQGKKSYIVSTLLVIVSLIGLVSGDITLMDFVQSPDLLVLLNGLGLATLRAGIK